MVFFSWLGYDSLAYTGSTHDYSRVQNCCIDLIYNIVI